MFEDESEAGTAALAEEARWARLNSGGVHAGGARRERHSVGRCEILRINRDAGRVTSLGVRAA